MKYLVPTVCAAILTMGAPAFAAPALTSEGIADGFTLATAYTGGGGGSYGLLGAVADSSGNLIGSGYGYNQILSFSEGAGNTVNGLTYSDATAVAATPGTPTGIASAGGNVYVTILSNGIYKVGPALSLTGLSLDASISPAYGLWANPSTGHLLAGTSSGAYDIDPATGHVTAIGTPGFVDGVSVSPDGKTAYVEFNQQILGYSITNPDPSSPIFSSGTLYNSYAGNSNPSPDGTGVISGGPLSGDIVVSNNDGSIGLLDTSLIPGAPGYYTTILTGMGRGDLVAPDGNNGSLLVADYGQLLRLGLTTGTIGGPTNTPEPSTLMVLGSGIVGFRWLRRRVRRSN